MKQSITIVTDKIQGDFVLIMTNNQLSMGLKVSAIGVALYFIMKSYNRKV